MQKVPFFDPPLYNILQGEKTVLYAKISLTFNIRECNWNVPP